MAGAMRTRVATAELWEMGQLAIIRRMTKLAMSGTVDERVRAACAMFDLARTVMVSGLRSEHPGINSADLRVKIFERTYGAEFNAAERARIISRLSGRTPPLMSRLPIGAL